METLYHRTRGCKMLKENCRQSENGIKLYGWHTLRSLILHVVSLHLGPCGSQPTLRSLSLFLYPGSGTDRVSEWEGWWRGAWGWVVRRVLMGVGAIGYIIVCPYALVTTHTNCSCPFVTATKVRPTVPNPLKKSYRVTLYECNSLITG